MKTPIRLLGTCFVLVTPLLAFNLCGEDIALGEKAPSWIASAKQAHGIYRYENCGVALKDKKIVWYSKSIEVNGALKVYPTFDGAHFSHATLLFDNMDPGIGEESENFTDTEQLNGAIISIRTSMHNLKRVEAFYKDGNLTKMRYRYPYKEKSRFILEVEYGHAP